MLKRPKLLSESRSRPTTPSWAKKSSRSWASRRRTAKSRSGCGGGGGKGGSSARWGGWGGRGGAGGGGAEAGARPAAPPGVGDAPGLEVDVRQAIVAEALRRPLVGALQGVAAGQARANAVGEIFEVLELLGAVGAFGKEAGVRCGRQVVLLGQRARAGQGQRRQEQSEDERETLACHEASSF